MEGSCVCVWMYRSGDIIHQFELFLFISFHYYRTRHQNSFLTHPLLSSPHSGFSSHFFKFSSKQAGRMSIKQSDLWGVCDSRHTRTITLNVQFEEMAVLVLLLERSHLPFIHSSISVFSLLLCAHENANGKHAKIDIFLHFNYLESFFSFFSFI